MISSWIEEGLLYFCFGPDCLGQVDNFHACVWLRLVHPHDRLVGQD